MNHQDYQIVEDMIEDKYRIAQGNAQTINTFDSFEDAKEMLIRIIEFKKNSENDELDMDYELGIDWNEASRN